MDAHEVRIDPNGTKQFGQSHREDCPEVEWADGYADRYNEWWINGKLHREDEFNRRNRPLIGNKVQIGGKDY